MELSQIIPHIEALIFASDKPLTAVEIVELINNAFGFMEERVSFEQVETAISGICEKYSAEFYPFEVKESGGGFQFLTKKEFYKTVALLNGEKFLKRLSNAALETLAIIAYKQPITKGEIEAIRGVNSDYSVQKLLEKELIIISGRNEELPGKPLVYSTSKSFMDYFGINSTDDLPKIKEVLAEQSMQGTLINDAIKHHESSDTEVESTPDAEIVAEPMPDEVANPTNTTLIVADNGELIEQPLEGETATSTDDNLSKDPATDDTSSHDKQSDEKPDESTPDIKQED